MILNNVLEVHDCLTQKNVLGVVCEFNDMSNNASKPRL